MTIDILREMIEKDGAVNHKWVTRKFDGGQL